MPSSESNTGKALARRKLAEVAKHFSTSERALASEAICARLYEQSIWKQARSILFFWPMPSEPDLRPAIEEALSAGKLVALPRYLAAEKKYIACRVTHTVRDVLPGHYGIGEPNVSCPEIALNELDLFLVPGVGFSPSGGRLGRGKGYYDRLLTGVQGLKCGVAFDWQVTFDFPLEQHDIRLDCILTPTRWLSVGS
jgi:5-formyltetrahydrofolate cyclo-ligase